LEIDLRRAEKYDGLHGRNKMTVSRREFLVSGTVLSLSGAYHITSACASVKTQLLAAVAGEGASGLSSAAFAEQIDTVFTVRAGSLTAHRMKLIEVTKHAPLSKVKQDGFSIVFAAPRGEALTQNTYIFEHPRLGRFPMFIVPIGSGEQGTFYEAVFNRLVQA
jgi:hypothetical protein